MKKILAMILLCSLTIGSVFAAGSKETQTTKNVKLTIAGRDGSYGDALQIAADEYTKIHPEVTFELLKLSGSDLFEKTVIDIKTGTQTYDMIFVDDTNITQFQKSGWLTDLEDMGLTVDSDFIEPTVRLGRYPYAKDGSLYALPLVGNVALFAYRNDLFSKYGDGNPETWSELLAGIKKITENEPNIDGVVFRGVKGNPIVTGFLPIFWAFGGHVLDANGNVTMNNQATLDAFNYFLELAKFAPEGVSMYQSTQVKDALYSGTAAVASEVWPGWIGDLENPEKSSVVGKVSVVKAPGEKVQTTSMLGIWLGAIPKDSKHSQEALDFLKFFTSEKIQTLIAMETGVPPTRKSVFANQELLNKYPWYAAQEDALENGVARPRSPMWKQIEDQLGATLQRALIGEINAKQAVEEAQKNISNVLN